MSTLSPRGPRLLGMAGTEGGPGSQERLYLLFAAAALVAALLGGFLLAILLPLAAGGVLPWGGQYRALVQAHAWLQLQGWAGLFVAGMGLRLVPRLAGRRPLPGGVTLAVFGLLVSGLVLRTIGQMLGSHPWGAAGMLLGGATGAAGMAGFAMALGSVLRSGSGGWEPWRLFTWAGTVWWMVWAGLTLVSGIEGASHGGLVPARLEEGVTWVVLLGAIGNFIWAVQSRTVRVFFGRSVPTLGGLLAPAFLLNGGAAAIAVGLVPAFGDNFSWLNPAGLLMAGGATAWLPAAAGSLHGRAHRLRRRARAAAWFVLAANWWAVVAGALLVGAGVGGLLAAGGGLLGVRDAARHALGVGFITMLIVGMAELVAPVFALERMEERRPGIEYWLGWPALCLAAVLRVSAGLLLGQLDERGRLDMIATAGVLAWVGLASFAWGVVRARRKEPRMRALIRRGEAK